MGVLPFQIILSWVKHEGWATSFVKCNISLMMCIYKLNKNCIVDGIKASSSFSMKVYTVNVRSLTVNFTEFLFNFLKLGPPSEQLLLSLGLI